MATRRKVTLVDQEAEQLNLLDDENQPLIDEEDENTEAEEGIMPEDLDPAEEIIPGGPTAGEVVAWKEQFGKVIVSSFDVDLHIFWRPLSRLEYRTLMKKVEQIVLEGELSEIEANMENEENIAELCILWPKMTRKDFAGGLAGLPQVLSQQILSASGFSILTVREL